MKLYSTNDKNNVVDLKEAVLNAFPADKGLYMPESISKLPQSFIDNIEQYTFQEISYIVAQNIIGDTLSAADLYGIVNRAINFSAPITKLSDQISTLELFHGPTMAFKDFGARFMAELMSHFLATESRPTTILVATSGDTGGAVAAGFYEVPGINVVILYPSGKVSKLQEQQLTTWGKNIKAVEIDGVFDDCQALVKQAFLDADLKKKYAFSSANSINIARLIPQSFYYFEGYKQLKNIAEEIVFCIPSGNYGNLTAGLLAKKMGLPIHKFLAATNDNNTVPEYLSTGVYAAKPSVPTISNAMDVGNPSNFPRMKALYQQETESATWDNIKSDIIGYSYNDKQTHEAIIAIHKNHGYIADPHGAVGYLACQDYVAQNPTHHTTFLETAHPGKFTVPMKAALGDDLVMPEKLEAFMSGEKVSVKCGKAYDDFKALLMGGV